MKNWLVLILSIIVLGGCSQEPKEPTELERCIEANSVCSTKDCTESFKKWSEENAQGKCHSQGIY